MNDKVWVVDDNPAVAQSIATLLELEGIPSVVLLSRSDVIRQLKDGYQPKVMILDLGMPDGGGNAIIEEIMHHPDWVFTIIVLTGWEEQIRKEFRGRVLEVLVKTIPPLELIVHVRRAMGQRAQWSDSHD